MTGSRLRQADPVIASPPIGSFPPMFSRGARPTSDQVKNLRRHLRNTIRARTGLTMYGPPITQVWVYRHKNSRWKALAEIADVFDVTVQDMVGPRRFRRLMKPRQVGMYVLRTKLKMSFPDAGSLIRRDHTTVLHGCRKIDRQLRDGTEWLDLHRALNAVDDMLAREREKRSVVRS